MNEQSIPVYLDCNYDDVNATIQKLESIKNNISEFKSNDLLNCISGELKERFTGGSTSKLDISSEKIKFYIGNICSTMKNSLEIVDEVDNKSLEILRGYIENIFNYTKPIDRSKYPSLTDELFNELYDYALQHSDSDGYSFLNIEDINQRRDAIKLLLNLCSDKRITYKSLKDVYINSDDNDKKELYNLLENAMIISISPKIGDNPGCIYYCNRNDFIDLISLTSKDYYDEQTMQYIFFGMKAAEDSQIYNSFNNDTPISLSFGDLNVDIPSSDFLKYCTSKEYVRQGLFDYYSFFSDYIKNNDISDDSRVLFNINGIDFDLNVKKMKDIINMVDTKTRRSEFSNKVNDSDCIQYRFMGHLCKLMSYHSDEFYDTKKINVFGYPLNMSIYEFTNCLDENGEIVIEKLLESDKLSEIEKIRLQNLLPYESQKKLELSDLNIIGQGKALDFFYKYGSVMQSNLNSLGLYHVGEEETERLIQFCMDKYGFSEDEAYLIMRSFGRRSGCTTVDACNTIYELYDYDAIKFEQDFGYPMLITQKFDDGKEHEVLNGDMLLLDLYISSNIGSKDDDFILILDEDNNITINEKYLTENKNQTQTFLSETGTRYFGYDRGKRYDALNNFLQSNGIDVLKDYQVSYVANYLSKEDKYNFIVSAINDNKIVSAGLGYNGYYEMYPIDECYGMRYDGAHAVTVSGVTEEGVLVNSWGDLYYVPFEYFDNFYILEKK